MKLLPLVAERSTCPRRAVGAIITDAAGHILATGYNGTPAGSDHCTDKPCPGAADPAGDTTRCYAVHAEQNALLQCRELARAEVMYVSCTPCFTCAKLLANTGIQRVVVADDYVGDDRGAFVLRSFKRLWRYDPVADTITPAKR